MSNRVAIAGSDRLRLDVRVDRRPAGRLYNLPARTNNRQRGLFFAATLDFPPLDTFRKNVLG